MNGQNGKMVVNPIIFQITPSTADWLFPRPPTASADREWILRNLFQFTIAATENHTAFHRLGMRDLDEW
jgi:hypothetical protein